MRRHPAFLDTLVAAATLLLAAAACGGCEPAKARSDGEPFTVQAKDLRQSEIPNRRVEGELRGERFHMREAVYRVERMPRRRRLDLWLSDRPFDKCGVPMTTDSRKVWLRFEGRTELEPGARRVDPDDGEPPFSMHYEVPADPEWIGVQGGAALLLVDQVDEDTIAGRLNACFDDGQGSCVRGRFRAQKCAGELDVDDAVRGAGVLEPDRPLPEGAP